MKDFSELCHDFFKNQELVSVLEGCSSAEDIIKGFAKKGYEVTDDDLNGFCEEKFPKILEDNPELKEALAQSGEADLNGFCSLIPICIALCTVMAGGTGYMIVSKVKGC